MIHIDESDPVGENESPFSTRTVEILRGVNPEDKYELIRELGRGKFGTVYRCREKTTNLQLAAKFVGIPKRGDRRNVEREVEIMNNLHHHLITQLYDAFEYQKMMCVVLELIEGGELFERVIGDDFILTERACIVFVRQICEALEFIHRKHILHLDLKPENIMCLTREGNRIKIIDFGLARKFDPEKKMQILFGTPEFVAPEVVNFDSIGFSTDMWSVGVICYVLLSGLSPFMGETDIETMANVTISKYDFDDEAFNEVSEEALNFITSLLLKEPEKRMTATDCLEHDWLRRQPPKRPPLTTHSIMIPKVELIAAVSPSNSPTPPPTADRREDEFATDNDLDSSTLSDVENNSEPEDTVSRVPPPLPKTAPPPVELLIESSLPIIIPTTTRPAASATTTSGQSDQLLLPKTSTTGDSRAAVEAVTGNITDRKKARQKKDMDKELDVAKDNLKTFVERYDGSNPVEIPKSPSLATLKPVAQPKKSSSTSSLNKYKTTTTTTTEKKHAKTSHNDVGKSSDFITPARNDNDSIPPVIPNQKQSELPVKGSGIVKKKKQTTGEGERTKELSTSSSSSTNDNGVQVVGGGGGGGFTKNLLEQLDQIKTTSPAATPTTTTTPKNPNDKTTNGVNYLQVGNNLPTSNGSSALSSRGCSPSPCESLSSTADMLDQSAELAEKDTFDESSVKGPSTLLRDYLQTFDRRKSDSNYVLGSKNNPTAKAEKMDLVDEIKRLSDHLMLLNSMKADETALLEEEEKKPDQDSLREPRQSASKRSPSPVANSKANDGTTERRNSRPKLTDPANLSSKLESKIVKSQILKFSSTNGQESSSTASRTTTTTTTHMAVNNQTTTGTSVSSSSTSSVRTATRLIEELHKPQTPISTPPWMLKCKRTKFRMTELSRDVPQNAPDSHKTVFIEEAATNTKDCLLQLLEKYNQNTSDDFEKRSLDIDRSVIPSSSSSSSSSIASLPVQKSGAMAKHQSANKVTKTSTNIASSNGDTVMQTMTTTRTITTAASSSQSGKKESSKEAKGGENGVEQPEFAKNMRRHYSLAHNCFKDSLEETTMNSLNTFFQRHSSHVGSSNVKQIQQQIEAKRVPQN